MVSRSGLIRILSGLPRPRPWSGGQRDVEDARVRLQRLALEAGADDPDHLAGAAQRLVVGHPVEALDDLRPGGAEAEHGAAAGDVVEAGGGLEDRAGGAREDVEDAGARSAASRSWRPGSPSASGSRSRRPRPPRPCRGPPSRARRPGQRSRAGCRRTGGESRGARPNCDSFTVTVARQGRRPGDDDLGRSVRRRRRREHPQRAAERGPQVGGVLGGDVVGVAVAQRAADDDRALALVAEPRRRVDDPGARDAGRLDGDVAEDLGALDRLEHAVAEGRVAGGEAGRRVLGVTWARRGSATTSSAAASSSRNSSS